MNNQPHALSEKEINEIAAMPDIREMWGAETDQDMIDLLKETVYAVKFHYVSGSPGYVGDYFILQGDALGEALELTREQDGSLKII